MYSYINFLKDKKTHHINPDFANIGKYGENEMDEIINNLYLGNFKAAYNLKELKKHNIKRVVVLCDNVEAPFKNEGIKYFMIPIKDRDLAEKEFNNGVNVNEYMLNKLTQAIIFIYGGLKNNEGVLIHCKKGASRSAYLTKIYLRLLYNKDSQEAEDFIKQKRFIAFPSYKNISKFEEPIIKNKPLFTQKIIELFHS